MIALRGCVRICIERRLVELVQGADDRQAPDELGDQAVLDEVLRLDALERRARDRGARCDLTSALKPSVFLPARRSMIFSSPTNAPPQMKRMLVVSIWKNSWCGCLRPPCGGTLATVPSRIFSSACCTPSPDTSRVIEGFSSLRQILSTSSM